MKNILRSSVLIPFVTFIGLQSGVSQEVELANSMLWSVVNTKSPADTSYLFGTIHQISQKEFTIKDKLINSLYKTDALLTEMDLSEPEKAKVMKDYMFMKDGMTLDQLLSKKEYATLNGFMLEGTGESLTKYNKNVPFITSSALMNYYIEGVPASYDMVLTQMAIGDSMRISGLESVEDQMSVMDKMSYKDQAKYLMEIVNNNEETKLRFRAIVDAYKAENLDSLSILLDENLHTKDEKKYLITDRNKKWVPVIESAMKDQNTFIAVGAGHLGGELGLINLLRKKGYIVEPVIDEAEE